MRDHDPVRGAGYVGEEAAFLSLLEWVGLGWGGAGGMGIKVRGS